MTVSSEETCYLLFRSCGARRAANGRPYGGCGLCGRPMTAPTARHGPESVIARPVRRLVVAIRNPRPFSMFSNGNLKTPQFSIRPGGRQWRSKTAATGGCGRGVEDAAPYGETRSRFCHCEGRYGPWQSASPVPFSMFSNSNLKTPPFSILNSQFSICRGRGACGGQWPPLRAGAGGRQWRSMTAATAGADGRQWRPMAAATAGAGGASRTPPPTARQGPESVIARPVRTLAVAIRIPRPLMPDACCLLPVASSLAGHPWRATLAATGLSAPQGPFAAGRRPAFPGGCSRGPASVRR